MAARYILAILAGAFLVAGARGMTTPEQRIRSRTWLLVGGIFALVSVWLFSRA